jgi:hypothetical protein
VGVVVLGFVSFFAGGGVAFVFFGLVFFRGCEMLVRGLFAAFAAGAALEGGLEEGVEGTVLFLIVFGAVHRVFTCLLVCSALFLFFGDCSVLEGSLFRLWVGEDPESTFFEDAFAGDLTVETGFVAVLDGLLRVSAGELADVWVFGVLVLLA